MKTTLIALFGEIRKGLLISWTYKVNQLISLLTLGFIFFVIVYMMGGGKIDPAKAGSALVGYLIWMYVVSAISDLSFGLRAEMSAGTLEQLEMSPVRVGLLLVGRVIANIIITTIQVMVLGTVILLIFKIRIPWRLEALPAFLLTLVGVLGFGFLIAGAVLIFKQVESFANLMNTALAFLIGSLLTVSVLPAWLAGISMSLPSTLGIIVIRRIIFEGKTLANTWQDGSLVGLAINSILYLLIGWTIFFLCERLAKNRGSLGQY